MSKKQLYIAYGSNINLDQMAYRCPHFLPDKCAMYRLPYAHPGQFLSASLRLTEPTFFREVVTSLRQSTILHAIQLLTT